MPDPQAKDLLEAAILALPGVEKRRSRFGSRQPAFFVGTREIAHFHGSQAIDVRLGKDGVRVHREALRALPGYLPRKSASPWAELKLAGPESVPELLVWVRRAIEG